MNPRASTQPLVTVAITTCEDETRVEECLRIARSQDYPGEALEIVVADGMSMDATREIVLRIAAEDPRVRLVDNPRRTRAAALNAVLADCRGELIVPMDPGGDYARTHVAKCVEALSSSPDDQLAIVPRSTGSTVVERALSAVQSTKLAFAAGADLARGVEAVPALLGAVRRRVFDRVGLFDPGARCEEDVELSRRITRAGGGLTVRRDIVVHRAGASSFKDLFRRHYELGRTRARRTIKDRRIASIRELAPLAIVTCGGALAATATIQPITPIAAAAYALMTGAAAVRVGRREGLVTIPVAWAAYPVMHVAHGVGYGSGLVRAALRPDWKTETTAVASVAPADAT
ncbi:MAG TPA: glycosyltransferase [Labilithrix sp.]|nr:glycosyltransferase [Labilithrix sp.]